MPLQSANPAQIIEIALWPKGGINQSTRRSAIEDIDFWFLENYFPVQTGELRAAWGPSPPIYSVASVPGLQILRIAFTCIDGVNPIGIMFRSDGIVDQVNLNTNAVTTLGQIWQPVAPHYWADMKLWRPNYFGATAGEGGGLLIGSPQGYYAWDGATVTPPGAQPPLWLTNGATTDASGNPLVMPSGLPGIYSMEVYNERMWIMGQTVISFSAPTNGADFSTAGGGGSFGYFGDQLTLSFTDLYTTAGSLYIFGDSMVNWIQNIQLVGQAPTGTAADVTNPFTTEFQLSNYNPQIGQRFYRPVGQWLQALTTFDQVGAYLITGDGQATWTSEKISNLWVTLNPNAFEGTVAPCHIFGQRWLLYNGTFTDPDGNARSMMLCWNGQIWTAATQRYHLTNIGYFEENSCISAYGTDGTVLVKLFAQPDPTLVKKLQTKAFNGHPPAPLDLKAWNRVYVEMTDLSDGGASLTGTLTTKGGGVPNGSEAVAFDVGPNQSDIRPQPTQGQGITAQLDLVGNSPDYTIQRIMLAYDTRTRFGA